MKPEELRNTATGTSIGVLTSGGDAQGMNAAIRAVMRTALFAGATPYAVREGYQGMIDGGDGITQLSWEDGSGILGKGGTAIGTYRCKEFTTREGQLTAAANLIEKGIDRLIVIGGDGSLAGLNEFHENWPDLIEELTDQNRITTDQAKAHPALICAGLMGSIDNDLVGTDMTIGVDSALHRIRDAMDAISSTAASHQRCFVVEIMGRNCGYLALAAALCGGGDYLLIPEVPPEDHWEQTMVDQLKRSRQAGHKDSIVVVAEGAKTRDGQPITTNQVRETLEQGLNEEVRVTILGHVQRGGTPSAYDRWAPTWLGFEATAHVLTATCTQPPEVFGLRGEQIVRLPLDKAIPETRSVATLINDAQYDQVLDMRGTEYRHLLGVFNELTNPERTEPKKTDKRIGIIHAGALAPGMNTAAATATWLGISRGFQMVGINDSFVGLAEGRLQELAWKDVDAWAYEAGATLGTRRHTPVVEELYAISRALETAKIDALLIIGGWTGYNTASIINIERSRYPGLQIPIAAIPVAIDNNLPGTVMAVGADAALNHVVESIDQVRMSASANRRCFVIETMGRNSGFLALMGGLAGGAEQVYLPEKPITMESLGQDITWIKKSFDDNGRSFFLAVRNENASKNYTTDTIAHLLDEEGQGRYDTRTLIIGHTQQGVTPTPADRLLATRLTETAITHLATQITNHDTSITCVGTSHNAITLTPIDQAMAAMDPDAQRPQDPWWMPLKSILDSLNREQSTH